MSMDEPPYCGDCGMSHRGKHARAEFCQACNLLMTGDDDQVLVCTNDACRRCGEGLELRLVLRRGRRS